MIADFTASAEYHPTMIQAFYQSKPQQDTPYRQLSLSHKNGWHVRLVAGEKWGPDNATELQRLPAKSFEEAKDIYDRLFTQLHDEGWKAYSPYEIW